MKKITAFLSALWVCIAACSTSQKPGETSTDRGSACDLREPDPKSLFFIGSGAGNFWLAGFLKEAAERRRTFSQIAASDLGALIAALYLTSENENRFEWKLNKLRNDYLETDESLLRTLFHGRRKKKFAEFIKQELGGVRLESLPARLCVAVLTDATPHWHFQCSGLASEAIERSIGVLPTPVDASVNAPHLCASSRWVSVNALAPEEAQAVTSALPKAAEPFFLDAPLAFDPGLKSFLMSEFQKRSEILYRGTLSFREHSTELESRIFKP